MDHKVTFGGKPVTLVGNRCKVGEIAPVFTVTDAGLQPVSSDVFHGKVRIYSVFPSVDTPVCSLQNIRFNREASKLGDNVVPAAISDTKDFDAVPYMEKDSDGRIVRGWHKLTFVPDRMTGISGTAYIKTFVTAFAGGNY